MVKNKNNSKRADIIYAPISDKPTFYIEEIRTSCSSYTWNIELNQIIALENLIKSQKTRIDKGEIKYDITGKNGHNCATWALSMMDALQLKVEKCKFIPFIVPTT